MKNKDGLNLSMCPFACQCEINVVRKLFIVKRFFVWVYSIRKIVCSCNLGQDSLLFRLLKVMFRAIVFVLR